MRQALKEHQTRYLSIVSVREALTRAAPDNRTESPTAAGGTLRETFTARSRAPRTRHRKLG